MVNMVDIMAKDTGLSYEASKRVLWIWCREWELKHQDLVKERLAAKDGDCEDLKIYLNGLEYVLGGNEYSETTQRYHWKDLGVGMWVWISRQAVLLEKCCLVLTYDQLELQSLSLLVTDRI